MNEDQRKQYLIEIGNRIKQLRTEKDMSQDELAKRSGYGSRSTINKIELGINDVPIQDKSHSRSVGGERWNASLLG